MPSAPIIPPMSGMPEPEKMLPPLPVTPVLAKPAPLLVWYQVGNHTAEGLAPSAWTSSRLRLSTSSILPWRPSAVPHTTAWSGVSSHSRPASSTTCCIERAWSMVFSRVRRYAASIARIIAPLRVTTGMAWAMITIRMPATIAATPMSVIPAIGTLNPITSAMTPPMIASTPRPVQRVMALLGASLNQPRATTCFSSALSNSPTDEPNSGSSSDEMKSPLPVPPSPRSLWSATSSAGPIGRRALSARRPSSTWSPRAGSVWMPTFLDVPRIPPPSSWNVISPRLARSSIAVVRARREVRPSMTIAPDAAVRSAGGAGIRIDGSSR